jgi:hypothetical protein
MSDAWAREQARVAEQREAQRQQAQREEDQRLARRAEEQRLAFTREQKQIEAIAIERAARFPCWACGREISTYPCPTCRAIERAVEEQRLHQTQERWARMFDSGARNQDIARPSTKPAAAGSTGPAAQQPVQVTPIEQRHMDAFYSRLSDCDELRRLWTHAATRKNARDARPLTWTSARRNFWKLISDHDPDDESLAADIAFVRAVLQSAGYQLRPGGAAPLLNMDWESGSARRRAVARTLSLDHITPRSVEEGWLLDPRNLRFLAMDENARRSDKDSLRRTD